MLIFLVISLASSLYAQDKYPPPGKLIDIGGYKLHVLVEGEQHGGATIVFFHGAGDIALHWNLVLPKVGEFATAVAIDQNGEGWSDHGHGMALNQQVYDSYQMLKKGGFNEPYILVGHSLGGIIANLFAVAYPKKVAGVVMVDATHPDIILKMFNREKGEMEWTKMRETADQEIPEINTSKLYKPKETKSFQPRRDFGALLDSFSDKDRSLFNWIYNERPWTYVPGQGNTYEAEIFQEMFANRKTYSLKSIPLIVISGGDKKIPEGDENWSSNELVAHSKKLQKDLLSLSTNSSQLIAKDSGHQIHLDDPDIIKSAIKDMLRRIKEEND